MKAQIRPGNCLQVGGFVGCGMPELLVNAVRERFDSTGHPRGLHLLQVATVGDGKGRGMYGTFAAIEGFLQRWLDSPSEGSGDSDDSSCPESSWCLPAPTLLKQVFASCRDRLAVEGLVTKYTYGWTGLSPGYARLITQGKMLAWNLPLGVISHTIRCSPKLEACVWMSGARSAD